MCAAIVQKNFHYFSAKLIITDLVPAFSGENTSDIDQKSSFVHTDGEYEPVINVAFLSFGNLFYFIIENHHSSVKLYNPEYVYCCKKILTKN